MDNLNLAAINTRANPRSWAAVARNQASTSGLAAVDAETGAMTVSPSANTPTSSLPPGVASQSSALAVLPMFVAPASRRMAGPLHSPVSRAQLLRQQALMGTMQNLLDVKPVSPSVVGASPRQNLRRSFQQMAGRSANDQEITSLASAGQDWKRARRGEALDAIAQAPSVYRMVSDVALKAATGLKLERLSASSITRTHPADYLAMKGVLTDILGIQIPDNVSLWNYMHSPAGLSQSNHLITVVKLNGVPAWRWFSVSGGKTPPLNPVTGLLQFGLADNKPDSNAVYTASVQGLKASRNKANCNVQANLSDLAPAHNAPVRYLGYPDLTISNRGFKEVRLLPRTFTKATDGGLHDRSRDTEYAVMSAMGFILNAYPLNPNDALDIAMFSRLPMCSSCQNAVSSALSMPQFAKVKGFRIFS